MIRFASLRLACTAPVSLLLLLLAGCSAQPPALEPRAAPTAAAPESGGGSPAGMPDVDVTGATAVPQADPSAAAIGAAFAPSPAPVAPARPLSPRALPPDNPFGDVDVVAPYLRGTASWYGPGFHGEATANGETYNQYGLTAAHPMLPLGTKVEVENLNNGRKVWVRINDRGPYKKGRVLDLSKLAAQNLGIVDEGTAPVSIRVLRWPESIDPGLGLIAYTQFVVQVVSRPDPEEAGRFLAQYEQRFPGLAFRIDRPPGSNYTVIAGPYPDEAMARSAASHLQRDGVTALVRSYRK